MSIATTWGTTAAERGLPYPCDQALPDADATYFRAVSVDAPPSMLFPWLCQLRLAPYSYDWIDNFGRRSPPELRPGLTDLAAGQSVMRIFELVSWDAARHITVRLRPDGRARRLFGEVAVSYVIIPADAGCRLVAKLVVRYPRPPVGWVMRALLPWGDLVMMRRQLLNLKAHAERTSAEARR